MAPLPALVQQNLYHSLGRKPGLPVSLLVSVYGWPEVKWMMACSWHGKPGGRVARLMDKLADDSYSGLASTHRCETVSMWHLASRRADRQDR